MADTSSTDNVDAPDWHLRDWLSHFGKKQSSLTKELGWSKNRANIVWHSQQPYRRELVNEMAAWLGLQPYELLMKPRDALMLRRLREAAHEIVRQEDTSSGQTMNVAKAGEA